MKVLLINGSPRKEGNTYTALSETARQQGMVLSVGSTKTLLHNAAMVDRFIAMSGKSPNMRLNNTDFKELLFYGVRAAV